MVIFAGPIVCCYGPTTPAHLPGRRPRALVLARRAGAPLSQPSVSNQVAALEREIGVRLLAREPGGLRLEPEGAVLLEHADAIAERLELARTELAEAALGYRARLKIGAFPTALAGLIPAAVDRVLLDHRRSRSSSTRATRRAGRIGCGRANCMSRWPSGQRAAARRAGGPRAPRPHARALLVALAEDHPLAGGPRSRWRTCATRAGPPQCPTA